MTACRCGCGQPVPRKRATYVNLEHMKAHWAATGCRREHAQKAGRLAARAHRKKAFRKALADTGLTLTDRELRLYRAAYARGYQAGHMRGKYWGYRKGMAEAFGDRRRVA